MIAETNPIYSANCVIALENVDSVFEGRKFLGRLSFSALLNSLDGAEVVEGSIAILTTNHRERLGDLQVSPAALQSYLQRQENAKIAAADGDLRKLAS
jgi:hypothetical protein